MPGAAAISWDIWDSSSSLPQTGCWEEQLLCLFPSLPSLPPSLLPSGCSRPAFPATSLSPSPSACVVPPSVTVTVTCSLSSQCTSSCLDLPHTTPLGLYNFLSLLHFFAILLLTASFSNRSPLSLCLCHLSSLLTFLHLTPVTFSLRALFISTFLLFCSFHFVPQEKPKRNRCLTSSKLT